jgi:hypothetical protein
MMAMLAPPQARPFVPSPRPSDIVVKAAENAAGSQHAQINLIRMVKSLDKLDPLEEATNLTRKRDWEVSTSIVLIVMYADVDRLCNMLESCWTPCGNRMKDPRTVLGFYPTWTLR